MNDTNRSRRIDEIPRCKLSSNQTMLDAVRSLRVDDSPPKKKKRRGWLSDKECHERREAIYLKRLPGLIKELFKCIQRAGFRIEDANCESYSGSISRYYDVGNEQQPFARIRLSNHRTKNRNCCTINVLVRSNLNGSIWLMDAETNQGIDTDDIVERLRVSAREPMPDAEWEFEAEE